jgi:hypothetical protein
VASRRQLNQLFGATMIIDIHGHYTTAPKALETWRNRQIAGINDPSQRPHVSELQIGDDDLRESIESNQLRLMRERGLDCRSPARGRQSATSCVIA